MDQVTVRVDASGRVVIPRDLRDAVGIPDGGELRLTVRDEELRATTRLAALRRIRAELRGLTAAEPVIGFTAPMAARATRLLVGLRRQGLSLGDAACLGTAAVLGLPVLTTDRLWAELETGVVVRLLR